LREALSDEIFRLESDYYSVKRETFLSYKGADIVTFSQYGTSKDLNEDSSGFKILRLNEFDSYFVGPPAKRCDLIDYSTYKELQLKAGDVLISRTNGNPKLVGKAAVVMEDENCAYASYLFKIRTNKLIEPEVLTVFLRCKYGREQIEKYSMTGNQTNFSPAKFKQISVPKFDEEFQIKIKNLVKSAYFDLKKSHYLYSEAESLLLSELGLKDWQPKNDNVSIKSFSDFNKTGRLDSEYYQKKYDEYEKKLDNYGTVELEKLCKIQDKNFNPVGNSSYSYIELSNIGNNGEITGFTEMMGSELPSRARRLVCEGDLLVSSIEGSLKSCAIVSKEYDKALCSTGFYVLTPTHMNVETMLLLFKSAPIQDLMKKGCSGTILTAISKDELMKIKLPDVRKEIQRQISSKIQESFALQSESKRLLEEAKMLVEKEIEK